MKAKKLFNIISVHTALLCLTLCAVFALYGCFGDATVTPAAKDVTVKVMLEEADGVKVKSENPISVKWGESAEFELELEDGAVIDKLPDGAVLENGKLRLDGVKFPTTLKLETHRRTLCDFSIEDTEGGSITSTLSSGSHWSETEITLTATPADGYLFAGFSAGASLESGGEIISLDPSYSFTLSQSVKLFANFTKEWVDPAETVAVPNGKWVLIYHTNGGVLADTGAEGMKTVHFSNDYYYCPNALTDRGYFKREGYVLLGYNTKADGSGKYYAPGWNVVMPEERDAISLFCIWAKESDASDFTYVLESDGTVTISKYNGSSEFAVIPETIEGKPVTRIKKGCFYKASAKQIMITKNIRTVDDNAFYKCDALNEVYFCDSVTSITDNSFYLCPNFSRINMIAVVGAAFQNTRHGSCSSKYEKLLVETRPKIIISSGSNCVYGIDSDMLIKSLAANGYNYELVNYSTSAAVPSPFINDIIASLINEGDILLLAPEISHPTQLGKSQMSSTLWQILEGAYDAIALVDIRNYTSFFASFKAFNRTRDQNAYSENCYEVHVKNFNSLGESTNSRVGYSSTYAKTVQNYLNNGGVGEYSFDNGVDSIEKYKENLNRAYDVATAKGATVLMSFSVINRISLTAESQTDHGDAQNAYMAAIDEMLHVIRISHVSTYVMNSEYFYDSDQHNNDVGRTVRTENLIADLLAYFESAKKED